MSAQCILGGSDSLRLVFTSDGVVVSIVVEGHKSAYDIVKIENQSRKRSQARQNPSQKNQKVSISSDSVYDSVTYDPVKIRLSESEAEVEEPTNHKAPNRTL